MSDGALLRLELALGALAVTAASVVLVIAADAVQFHAAALWRFTSHDIGAHDVLLLAVVVVDGGVIVRAARSLARQLAAHRALVRSLPVRAVIEVEGHPVRVVPGRSLRAFCAGLLRPAVYVSAGTLEQVRGPELRAILAHEHHHRARRDPLRMLLARVVADAFRPLRPLATLADRHTALADLAADAAAVRAVGGVQPLAAALVRFDRASGVAPERVDHLVRRGPPASVSAWLLAVAALALGGIAGVTVPMLLLGWHFEPRFPVALELAAIVAVCTPAYLAARRVDACLRP
jgi:Zn-dependent protease with chaperone function